MKNPIMWAAAVLMASCTPVLKVEVANTTPTERDDETVEIAWSGVAALKGVTPENIPEFRKAGCLGVGLASSLMPKGKAVCPLWVGGFAA